MSKPLVWALLTATRLLVVFFALVGLWFTGTTLALAQFGLTMEQAKAYASIDRAMPAATMKGGL